jgi:hypothetical protein
MGTWRRAVAPQMPAAGDSAAIRPARPANCSGEGSRRRSRWFGYAALRTLTIAAITLPSRWRGAIIGMQLPVGFEVISRTQGSPKSLSHRPELLLGAADTPILVLRRGDERVRSNGVRTVEL